MKKLFTITSLAIFIIVLIPASCKKDKDKISKEQLIGWWDATKVKMVEYEDDVKTSENTTTIPAGTFAFELQADGDAYMYYLCEADTPAEWELDGNSLIIDGDVVDYTLSGNTIVFTIVEEDIDGGITYRAEMTFTCTKGDGSTCD